MIFAALGVVILMFVLAVGGSALWGRVVELEHLKECGRRTDEELDRKLVDLRQRVLAVESRLGVLGAPGPAEDLDALRRVLEEIQQHLAEEEDREQWWRKGGEPW